MSSKKIFAPGVGANDAPSQAAQYNKGSLYRSELAASPITQFHAWFSHAQQSGVPQPEAVCLSTAALPSGKVSARFVYLKELDDRGFVIYSNWGTSRKHEDISSNPYASLTFWWRELERQVRVEGPVERLTSEESQVYYDTRTRGSRIGAWASEQSEYLSPSGNPGDDGREELEQRVRSVEKMFDGKEEIPVPHFWGGLRVKPEMIEFWQGRESRLHDRFQYAKAGDTWEIDRLSP